MSDEHQCTRGEAGGGDGHVHGITCREISEFLLAYLERDLDSDARAEFERHLNLCPPCVHYLEGYRETIELVRRCVHDQSGGGGGDSIDGAAQKPEHKPPEGLIQAILAAKRSSDRG